MADKKKKSFVLYTDSLPLFMGLSDEESGQLIKAIIKHASGEHVELEGSVGAIYQYIANRIDYDSAKYEDVCAQRRLAGAKGGKAKANNSKANKSKL